MQTYPTDLTEKKQIAQLETLLPTLEPHPRRTWDYLIIFNAIFYVLDNGIKWRAMPVNFPPWGTVYGYWGALIFLCKRQPAKITFQPNDQQTQSQTRITPPVLILTMHLVS
jgi:transposase